LADDERQLADARRQLAEAERKSADGIAQMAENELPVADAVSHVAAGGSQLGDSCRSDGKSFRKGHAKWVSLGVSFGPARAENAPIVADRGRNMASVVTRSGGQIVFQARQKLGLMQREMASAIGTSLRTLSRFEAGESWPADFHLHKLAALVHSVDADLAREAAAAGGKTLEQLGIVKPVAPPEPPPKPVAATPAPSPAPPAPAVPPRLLIDAVVCAVAAALEALEGAPVSLVRARAAVAAAFTSAHGLRLGIDDAAAAVAPAPEKTQAISTVAKNARDKSKKSLRAREKLNRKTGRREDL
jgi:transcriptional regulator with XRE-family HTH domain